MASTFLDLKQQGNNACHRKTINYIMPTTNALNVTGTTATYSMQCEHPHLQGILVCKN